ncbi:MAG: hypothetical protein R3F59_26175 [Myxococcota bacterium]
MERARQFRPELLNRPDGVVVFRDHPGRPARQVVALHLRSGCGSGRPTAACG